MTKIFLACSRNDSREAQEVLRELKRRHASVLTDEEVLVSGGADSSRVVSAIEAADMVIVLLSRHSRRDKPVDVVLADALERKTIIPVLLDHEAKNNWIWPLIADRQTIERI